MPTNSTPALMRDIPDVSTQATPDVSAQAQSIPSGPVRSTELVQLRVQRFHPHQPHDEPVDPQHGGVRDLSGVIHDILNTGIEGDSGHASRVEGHDIALSNQASVVSVQPLAEPVMELAGRQDEAIGANDVTLVERWFDCILPIVWVFFTPFLPN